MTQEVINDPFRCTDEKNCIIMPGYCVAGTVGHRILHGERRIQLVGRIVDIKGHLGEILFLT